MSRNLRWLPALLAVLVGINELFVRRRVMNWGATEAELREPLPGDELVPDPVSLSTRGVTIDAPPSVVWPWIVQMGYGRAGWYSHDRIEWLMAAGKYAEGHSAQHIHPELQDLKVGDMVPFSRFNSIPVTAVEPEHYLVIGSSWAFVLRPLDRNGTRLIVRTRNPGFLPRYGPPWGAVVRLLDLALNYLGYEPGLHLLMERRMMLGIKERAERMAEGS